MDRPGRQLANQTQGCECAEVYHHSIPAQAECMLLTLYAALGRFYTFVWLRSLRGLSVLPLNVGQ